MGTLGKHNPGSITAGYSLKARAAQAFVRMRGDATHYLNDRRQTFSALHNGQRHKVNIDEKARHVAKRLIDRSAASQRKFGVFSALARKR